MKKTYIAPEMEVMNIETVEMIATSIAVVNDEGDEMLGNDRRGGWGNLWD